jgi:hypothetical protein
MVFNPDNYLDIYHIVTYEIVGAVWLVIALGVILIAYFSAKYAIPFQAGGLFILLWVAIISILSGNLGLWALIVAAVGGLFYWVFSGMFRRN